MKCFCEHVAGIWLVSLTSDGVGANAQHVDMKKAILSAHAKLLNQLFTIKTNKSCKRLN